MPEGTVNVRYMVHDVDAAVEFYTKHFGFTVGTHAAPAFAATCSSATCACCSAGRPAPRGGRCRTGRSPALAAGTGSSS